MICLAMHSWRAEALSVWRFLYLDSNSYRKPLYMQQQVKENVVGNLSSVYQMSQTNPQSTVHLWLHDSDTITYT